MIFGTLEVQALLVQATRPWTLCNESYVHYQDGPAIHNIDCSFYKGIKHKSCRVLCKRLLGAIQGVSGIARIRIRFVRLPSVEFSEVKSEKILQYNQHVRVVGILGGSLL